ncbi:hypothetical protein EV363DRAFT_1420562 [Boletus edulis]|nr:hypothetical protein EV363DRAFT_1420562 [Boletus edulis]
MNGRVHKKESERMRILPSKKDATNRSHIRGDTKIAPDRVGEEGGERGTIPQTKLNIPHVELEEPPLGDHSALMVKMHVSHSRAQNCARRVEARGKPLPVLIVFATCLVTSTCAQQPKLPALFPQPNPADIFVCTFDSEQPHERLDGYFELVFACDFGSGALCLGVTADTSVGLTERRRTKARASGWLVQANEHDAENVGFLWVIHVGCPVERGKGEGEPDTLKCGGLGNAWERERQQE